MKHFKKYILTVLLALLMIFFTASASALEQEIPGDTYTYWNVGSARKLQPARPMYTVERVLYGYNFNLEDFSGPENIYISNANEIYLSDSGNGRVIVLNADLSLKQVISEFVYNGESLNVTGLGGVFADSNNRLLAADPEHARILISNMDGSVEHILTLPESELIPEDFNFIPKKVLADSNGTIYVISQGSFYGAVMYSPDYSFAGFFGSNKVSATIQDIPEKIIEMIFGNDEKKGSSVQALPFQFTDFCIDSRDFIYTSTGMVSGWYVVPEQIKKLSPGGVNILKARSGLNLNSANNFDFGDVGISARTNQMKRIQDFCSMDVDGNGLMYLLDRTYGRIFVYNSECVLMNAFGGGVEEGQQKGTYEMASSIAVTERGDRIFVTDSNKNSLTVYTETSYGASYRQAIHHSSNGDYKTALPIWKSVVKNDKNNQLALRSIAQIYLAEKDYINALDYSKKALDQDIYSQAFPVLRNRFLSQNVWWMILILLLTAAAGTAFAVIKRKRSIALAVNRKFSIMMSSVLHPFESFRSVKYSGGGSVSLAAGILFVWFLLQVILSLFSGFMYNVTNAGSYNMLFTLGSTVGLVLLWTVVNWALGTLLDGKGRTREIFIMTCYCLLPQVIYSLIYLVSSHILTPDEALVMSISFTVCILASLFMLCVGTITVHELSFVRFVGLTILTLAGMFLAVFIIFLIGILFQQFVVFLSTLYKEVVYR